MNNNRRRDNKEKWRAVKQIGGWSRDEFDFQNNNIKSISFKLTATKTYQGGDTFLPISGANPRTFNNLSKQELYQEWGLDQLQSKTEIFGEEKSYNSKAIRTYALHMHMHCRLGPTPKKSSLLVQIQRCMHGYITRQDRRAWKRTRSWGFLLELLGGYDK